MKRLDNVVSICLIVTVLAAAVSYYIFQSTSMCCVVELIGPSDRVALRTSPVELFARATGGGVPQGGLTTRFTVDDWTSGQVTVAETETDDYGYAKLLFPARPGNYSWHVTLMLEGYRIIVSNSSSFSVKLLLVVEPLLPSTFILAVSPVNFRARVTGANGFPLQSAEVTFYVDSIVIGSNTTGQNGIAELSTPLNSGRHIWFASASKEAEGGISDETLFIVGQPASLMTDDSL